MKAMKQIKEVSMTEQFITVVDLLEALGYDVKDLTLLDVAKLRYDIIKAIEECEFSTLYFNDPLPGKVN
jgi:hypothetical protein